VSSWTAERNGDYPRCEFVNAIDRMVSDACEHIAQIRLRIDAIEFYCANHAVDGGGTFAARVCSSEQRVTAPDVHHT
jgi:hypothetical protein